MFILELIVWEKKKRTMWLTAQLSFGKWTDRFELKGTTDGWPKVISYKLYRIGLCGISTLLTVEEDLVEFFLLVYGKTNSLNTTCLKIKSSSLSSRHL